MSALDIENLHSGNRVTSTLPEPHPQHSRGISSHRRHCHCYLFDAISPRNKFEMTVIDLKKLTTFHKLRTKVLTNPTPIPTLPKVADPHGSQRQIKVIPFSNFSLLGVGEYFSINNKYCTDVLRMSPRSPLNQSRLYRPKQE